MASIELEAAGRLAVAGLVGLAVGVERERSGHASGPLARFAGVRTFFILGLQGGVAGWLLSLGWTAAAAVLLASGAALAIAAYAVAVRSGAGVDGTTEAAALAVIALAATAGLGHLGVAGGAAAVMVFALSEKDLVGRLLQRIDEMELRAAFQFAVLALVILPLLPSGPFGPFGTIRPRALWTVVLLFTGINFAGYLARRAVGPGRGYGLTGLLGGLISSTAVTFSFSRQSRQQAGLAPALGLGVLAASTMLLPRIGVVTLLLHARLAAALIPFLLPPLLLGSLLVVLALRRAPGGDRQEDAELDNPLQFWSAIRMALAFQLVLIAVAWVRLHFGSSGVLTSAALLGLTDTDALTLSMIRLAAVPNMLALAARAIAVAVLANGVLKLILTLVFGAPTFRRVASVGLIALIAASGLGLWWGW